MVYGLGVCYVMLCNCLRVVCVFLLVCLCKQINAREHRTHNIIPHSTRRSKRAVSYLHGMSHHLLFLIGWVR